MQQRLKNKYDQINEEVAKQKKAIENLDSQITMHRGFVRESNDELTKLRTKKRQVNDAIVKEKEIERKLREENDRLHAELQSLPQDLFEHVMNGMRESLRTSVGRESAVD